MNEMICISLPIAIVLVTCLVALGVCIAGFAFANHDSNRRKG